MPIAIVIKQLLPMMCVRSGCRGDVWMSPVSRGTLARWSRACYSMEVVDTCSFLLLLLNQDLEAGDVVEAFWCQIGVPPTHQEITRRVLLIK